jgi:hypothetical protein
MNYKLIPSDLTFLYEGCKHCFVLKVKHGISQPSIPLPAIFSTIASLQKEYYSGRRLEEICRGLPPGKITYGEKRVKTDVIEIPGCESTCSINGRFDIVAELDDGSFAVLDFKTGNPSDAKSEMYARQLHCYALALENPAPGALQLSPISKLGLVYFTPDKCEKLDTTRQKLEGEMQWVEIVRNDQEFLDFLRDVVTLLDGPMPDLEPDTCDWCKYHEKQSGIVSHAVNALEKAVPQCPKCDSDMVLKTGKYGEFWSCTKFPDCKGTRNV